MANQFITTSKVADLALEVLKNKGVLLKGMNKQYNEEFAQKSGQKIGYTVNAKKPPRYETGEGPVIDIQATTQTYVPVSINHQTNVGVSIQASDYALSASNFQDDILEPIMAQIANKVELQAFQELTKTVSNFVVPNGGLGTLDAATSTAAQSVATIGQVGQFMTEYAADEEGRMMLIAPKVNTGLVTAYSSLFNSQAKGAKRFDTGLIGDALGFEFARSVNVRTFTNGTLNTTAAAGASAQGSSNAVQADSSTPFSMTIAAPSATIKIGQKITIAGLYAVNPQSRESLGRLQTFTVVDNGTADTDVGASDTTMRILPYPVFTGAFKNVHSSTNNIAANAVITSVSGLNSTSYTHNLAFVDSAFTLCTARLWTPKSNPGGGEAAFAYDRDSGLSIRFVRDWFDARTDQAITRFDVLWGVKAVYPELACVVSG